MYGSFEAAHVRPRRRTHASAANDVTGVGYARAALHTEVHRVVGASRVFRRAGAAALAPIAAAALLATGALAAKPKHGAHFAGSTSTTPVEGFRAPVKFTVSPDGRSLFNFTFGSFGCFGAGGFRPGIDPYTGHSLIDAGKVKVSASGHFSQKALSSYSVSGQTTTTTISISGSFSEPKKASGSITFSQVVSGSFHSSCGPAKVSFSASGH